MKKKTVEDCTNCKYHERCARIISGFLDGQIIVKSGNEDKPWCDNWKEFEKQGNNGV